MSKYEFSPEALADLEELLTYVADENERAADRLESVLQKAFEHLARWPESGHHREDITEQEVRFWTASRYLIVYRALADRVQIIALLHSSRDIPQILRFR
jgi:toxin ParE1/3/4